jgi:hypothetical protein
LRTPLRPEVNERAGLERARLDLEPTPELTMQFRRFPVQPVYPGDVVEFPVTENEVWPADAWQVLEGPFRVFDVELDARPLDQATEESQDRVEIARYQLFYKVRAEPKKDLTTPRLPPFVEPTYPVYIEGKIISEVDSEKESLTYQPKKVKDLLTYRVEVPLWKDTAAEINVPHNAGRMPGQLFFPAYKGERVVLAMTWRKAWIDSFIDWRPEARLPQELQGNRMLLGKKPKSSTFLESYYESQDSVQPVFKIQRTSATDQQFLCISEGKLVIEVTEENAQNEPAEKTTVTPERTEDVPEDQQN